jgi:hypothetical protein
MTTTVATTRRFSQRQINTAVIIVAVLILLSCCCWYLIGRQAWMAFSPSLPAIRTSAPGGVNFSLPATRTPAPAATRTPAPGITETPPVISTVTISTVAPGATSTAPAPANSYVIDIYGRNTQEIWAAEEYVRSVIVLKPSFTAELGIQPDLTALFGPVDDVTIAKILNVKTSFEMPNDALQARIFSDGQVWFIDRTNYVFGQLSCVKWDGSKLTAFVDDTKPHGTWGTGPGTCDGPEIAVHGPFDLSEVMAKLGEGEEFSAYAELGPQLRLAQQLLADPSNLDLNLDFQVVRVWLDDNVIFPFGR